MVPALSEAEIFDEVVVTPRRVFPPLRDLRVIERPGWLQIITPSIRTGSLNQVLFSALDEHDADAVIDATIAEYRALGLQFRWAVDFHSTPADLGKHLERRGPDRLPPAPVPVAVRRARHTQHKAALRTI